MFGNPNVAASKPRQHAITQCLTSSYPSIANARYVRLHG
jgi:hypothetical protein